MAGKCETASAAPTSDPHIRFTMILQICTEDCHTHRYANHHTDPHAYPHANSRYRPSRANPHVQIRSHMYSVVALLCNRIDINRAEVMRCIQSGYKASTVTRSEGYELCISLLDSHSYCVRVLSCRNSSTSTTVRQVSLEA